MVHTVPEGPLLPAPISAPGTYTISDIRAGCKVTMRRPIPGGGEEERLAEVLSIRQKPSPRNASATPSKAEVDPPETANGSGDSVTEQIEFFVHWHLFNKRLDEWVSATRVVLTKDLEWPRPKAPPGTATTATTATATATAAGSPAASGTATPTLTHPAVTKAATPLGRAGSVSLLKKATIASASQALSSPSGIGQKRKEHPDDTMEEDDGASIVSESVGDGMELDGAESDDGSSVVPAALDPRFAPTYMGKETEIEKLRHSGSMTQSVNEVQRVKNLNRIQIGKNEVEAWYFSPYPVEYAYLDVIFLCEFCLGYFPSQFMLGRHLKSCTLRHPPGNEVYRSKDETSGEEISFFEIDGKRQNTWCRNLSLLSKCFLDHKTLYYDVQPFLYYVMTTNDVHGCHLVGYFSKEKESAENYNVACILTLPQHQRKGYGKLLIEFSYELSKREMKLGSPEKPLSDLGLLGYKAYWMEIIIELLNDCHDDISIEEIANRTSITQNDVMWTCQQLGLFKYYKGQYVLCVTDQAMEQYKRAKAKQRKRIKPERIIWKPPVFSRDQLRFGY
ncbi:Histone acetyltransferase [Serendipita sp. 411]|nr:Histone acetyltransferase [Serendipita sp. 397]KAG8859832.1 Histone acetyltransferase [Serendipita sp. 411]